MDEIKEMLKEFFKYEISYIFDNNDMQRNIDSLKDLMYAFSKLTRELGVDHIEDIVDKLTEIYSEE